MRFSVDDLANALRKLDIHTLHPGCHASKKEFGDAITKAVDSIESPVLESHRGHMKAQAKRLGPTSRMLPDLLKRGNFSTRLRVSICTIEQ